MKKIVQPGAPTDKSHVNGTDTIILSELSQRQRTVLLDAASRIAAARRQVESLENEYRRLVAMAMPEGANGLDLEKGYFYYEKPTPPPQPALENPEDEPEDGEASD